MLGNGLSKTAKVLSNLSAANMGNQKHYHESQTSTFDEKLVLVDHNDNEIDILDKKTCHLNSYNEKGHPHRAFSLFLFNHNNELLLHQRSKLKIVFPLAWTNSCCSHPKVIETGANGFKSEPTDHAVIRRTLFELGIDLKGQKLCLVDKILYQSRYDEEWGEHEVDYVHFCKLDQETKVHPNPDQIEQYQWVSKDKLLHFIGELHDKGGCLSPWFNKIHTSNILGEWWDTLINEGIDSLCDIKPEKVRNFK